MYLVRLMWRSASESKPVHSRYSRLSQAWRTAKPIPITSAVSNWFRRRTSHELNSLNSIRLMWSTASEPGLRVSHHPRVEIVQYLSRLCRTISCINTRVKLTYNTAASSSRSLFQARSVSWGAARKTARGKIKKKGREQAKECLSANLTKGGRVYLFYRISFDGKRRESIN